MQMRAVEVHYLGKDGALIGQPEHLRLTESQCVAVAAEQGTFVDDGFRLESVRKAARCTVVKMVAVN